MLSFFPRDVLDEILNLIESVSEGFPSYSDLSGIDRVTITQGTLLNLTPVIPVRPVYARLSQKSK